VSILEAVAIGHAGLCAGTINTLVGSGTLITFPTLLAFGVPPITANVSNTIGLVPGSLSGAYGYRRELRGQRTRVVRLASASLLGGLVGGVLLLVLPDGAFGAVVPVLVLFGLVVVVLQPRISRAVAAAHERAGRDPGPTGAWWVWPGVLLTGVYGGYFGAAQGVLLMALMGIGVQESLQRLNAVKNILAMLVNLVAGVLFAFVADVDWRIVALIGVGSTIGGQVGASVGRRLPAPVLRAVIVVVGLVALTAFLLSD
jgi:uncharacterized protein